MLPRGKHAGEGYTTPIKYGANIEVERCNTSISLKCRPGEGYNVSVSVEPSRDGDRMHLSVWSADWRRDTMCLSLWSQVGRGIECTYQSRVQNVGGIPCACQCGAKVGRQDKMDLLIWSADWYNACGNATCLCED